MIIAEESRRLYEQIGTLYGLMRNEAGEEELSDFLATVRRIAERGWRDERAALATAIRRYEADRTGDRTGRR